MTVSRVILTGYSNDVVAIAEELRNHADVCVVDENASDAVELPAASIVAYVFSPDTCSSSQLLGVFTWIHHAAGEAEHCVLEIGEPDPRRFVFDFANELPRTTVDSLRARLAESGTA